MNYTPAEWDDIKSAIALLAEGKPEMEQRIRHKSSWEPFSGAVFLDGTWLSPEAAAQDAPVVEAGGCAAELLDSIPGFSGSRNVSDKHWSERRLAVECDHLHDVGRDAKGPCRILHRPKKMESLHRGGPAMTNAFPPSWRNAGSQHEVFAKWFSKKANELGDAKGELL